jgi:hypothetical protein
VPKDAAEAPRWPATALRPFGADTLVNLTVWESAEALWDFTYRARDHLDVLRRRREWFTPMAEAHLVLWWVEAGHLPDVGEARERLDLLRAQGPSPAAFDFRDRYDAPVAAVKGRRG